MLILVEELRNYKLPCVVCAFMVECCTQIRCSSTEVDWFALSPVANKTSIQTISTTIKLVKVKTIKQSYIYILLLVSPILAASVLPCLHSTSALAFCMPCRVRLHTRFIRGGSVNPNQFRSSCPCQFSGWLHSQHVHKIPQVSWCALLSGLLSF